MTTYVALLRAVNVGGTGKLPMADLRSMCAEAGYANVRTYIASGNVLFESGRAEAKVVAELEKRLAAYAGKPVGVMVRSRAELADVLAANPFSEAAAARTVAIFLAKPPPGDALARAAGIASEEMRLGKREIYVHYPDGIGISKLRIPAARDGTARNMRTVAKLVELASEA
jgi:uncharacterized protein (DUF1697 family)